MTAYYQQGNFDRCIETYLQAVALDEEAFYARFNIALSTLCKGEFEKAKALYQEYSNLATVHKTDISGAKTDLKDLIKKKVFKEEAQLILAEFF